MLEIHMTIRWNFSNALCHILWKICILDIDVQGAQAVKKSALKAKYIFIKPPAPEEEELERRLRGRWVSIFVSFHSIPGFTSMRFSMWPVIVLLVVDHLTTFMSDVRGTESEEQIQKRLRGAKQELERAKDPSLFDYILVNANLDHAYVELKVHSLLRTWFRVLNFS